MKLKQSFVYPVRKMFSHGYALNVAAMMYKIMWDGKFTLFKIYKKKIFSHGTVSSSNRIIDKKFVDISSCIN